MEILIELKNHFIVSAMVILLTWALFERATILRSLKCYYYGNKECRVSFALLLVIKHNGKYLLIRNINRNEIFGPIGGVYKYHDCAKAFLDEIQFRQHQHGSTKVKNDLRGFIPAINLNKIIKWFDKRIDREIECISREIKEELVKELRLSVNITREIPKFRIIKEISEGPYPINGENYLQFRRLDFCELVIEDKFNLWLINYLVRESDNNNDIELVTTEEIRKRRTQKSKQPIGTYCGYLIGNKRTGEEEPPY